MNENYDISAVERAVQDIIRDMEIVDKVFLNRPRAITDKLSAFVVVRVSNSIIDTGGYGRCTVDISLFARDENEEKNWKKLSVMFQSLVEDFPTSYEDTLLFEGKPTVFADVADDFGFHARIVQVKTIIKAS